MKITEAKRFYESGHQLVGQIVRKQQVLCLVASSVSPRLRQAASPLNIEVDYAV